MQEQLTPASVGPAETAQTAEQLVARRQQLANELVTHNLMSSDYANSGVLDAFYVDPATQLEGFSHILIGDEQGGAHHLRTIYRPGSAWQNRSLNH